MRLMDEQDGQEMKAKSPKFMKVETNDPEVAEKLLEKASPEEVEQPAEDESLQSEKEDDEERLKELYEKLRG